MRRKIDRDRVRRRAPSDHRRIEVNAKLLGVDRDPEIAVVLVVVFLQLESGGLDNWIRIEISDVGSLRGFLRGLAFLGLHQRVHIVSAVSADDEGHIELLAAEGYLARVALV